MLLQHHYESWSKKIKAFFQPMNFMNCWNSAPVICCTQSTTVFSRRNLLLVIDSALLVPSCPNFLDSCFPQLAIIFWIYCFFFQSCFVEDLLGSIMIIKTPIGMSSSFKILCPIFWTELLQWKLTIANLILGLGFMEKIFRKIVEFSKMWLNE